MSRSLFARLRRHLGRTTREPTRWPPPDPPVVAHLLDGRVAVVTGGAGLVGGAISVALAAAGARVAVNYLRSGDRARSVVDQVRAAGGTAVALQADVRDARQVAALVEAAERDLGAIDVLVNNASAVPGEADLKGFLDCDWRDYERYLDTALRGTVNCCHAVLPGMVARRRGRIVNIGTTSLHEVNAQLNPYVTAKGGLLGLTRSLAEEFGRYDISVNMVVPGWLWRHPDRAPEPEEARVFRDRSPLGMGLATPADVAAAVVFLASDMARAITAAYLPVCAGQIRLG